MTVDDESRSVLSGERRRMCPSISGARPSVVD